jgi:hypothetical protein
MPSGASHYLKVEYKNTIIGAILLKKIDGITVDMTRFCTDQLATYPGLMSKVVSYVRKNYSYKKIVTFADLRYSTGDVYKKSGFIEVSRLPPDYYYVWGNQRIHKFNMRKDDITRKFGILAENKTELMMSEEAGLLRIYDCGKIKYSIGI